MDPVTAFQLAAAVIATIDFSIKTVKEIYETVNSATGTSARNAALEERADELKKFVERLKVPNQNRTNPTLSADQSLVVTSAAADAVEQSADACEKAAERLIKCLHSFKIDTKKSIIPSMFSRIPLTAVECPLETFCIARKSIEEATYCML